MSEFHAENRINNIEAEVVGLKVAVNAIDEKIERQTQVITDLVKEERANPATQIAFASLFLAIVIFYNRLTIEPVMQAINYNKSTADREAILIIDKIDSQLEYNEEDISSIWNWIERYEDKDFSGRIKVLEAIQKVK